MKNASAVILCILCATIALVLAIGNPISESWPLKCPLFQITGWQCPLCGMQRMLHELMHLHLSRAYIYNKVLMVTLPYWAVLVAGQIFTHTQRNRVVAFCYRDKVIFFMIAVMAAWGVIRNI